VLQLVFPTPVSLFFLLFIYSCKSAYPIILYLEINCYTAHALMFSNLYFSVSLFLLNLSFGSHTVRSLKSFFYPQSIGGCEMVLNPFMPRSQFNGTGKQQLLMYCIKCALYSLVCVARARAYTCWPAGRINYVHAQ
jgi:hypothetical protein